MSKNYLYMLRCKDHKIEENNEKTMLKCLHFIIYTFTHLSVYITNNCNDYVMSLDNSYNKNMASIGVETYLTNSFNYT